MSRVQPAIDYGVSDMDSAADSARKGVLARKNGRDARFPMADNSVLGGDPGVYRICLLLAVVPIPSMIHDWMAGWHLPVAVLATQQVLMGVVAILFRWGYRRWAAWFPASGILPVDPWTNDEPRLDIVIMLLITSIIAGILVWRLRSTLRDSEKSAEALRSLAVATSGPADIFYEAVCLEMARVTGIQCVFIAESSSGDELLMTIRGMAVRLDTEKGWVTLTVSDDGRGTSLVASGRDKTLGLLGMHERARMAKRVILHDEIDGQRSRTGPQILSVNRNFGPLIEAVRAAGFAIRG